MSEIRLSRADFEERLRTSVHQIAVVYGSLFIGSMEYAAHRGLFGGEVPDMKVLAEWLVVANATLVETLSTIGEVIWEDR